jgi:cytochrome c peroxidase
MEAADMFTDAEWAGFQLFMNENNDLDGASRDDDEGAMCVLCHTVDWTDPNDLDNPVVVPEWSPEVDGVRMVPPMFTDFSFDNLGVPKNWDNPFLDQDAEFNPDGEDFIDLGLYRFLVDREDLWPIDGWEGIDGERGKFKVMTLRNIGLTAPYAHNGLFDSLKEITHFYNTRDVESEGWDLPETPGTVNDAELGNLGLSPEDEDNLVAFMETLSDVGKRRR